MRPAPRPAPIHTHGLADLRRRASRETEGLARGPRDAQNATQTVLGGGSDDLWLTPLWTRSIFSRSSRAKVAEW
jgi:hypothetical protein